MIRAMPIKVVAIAIFNRRVSSHAEISGLDCLAFCLLFFLALLSVADQIQRLRHAVGPSLADDDGHDRVPRFHTNNAHCVRRSSKTCSSFVLVWTLARGFALTPGAAARDLGNAPAVPNRNWQDRAERACVAMSAVVVER